MLPKLYQAFLLVFSGLLISCNASDSKKKDTATSSNQAQILVDKAIATHGGEKFNNLEISFDFRDKHYEATRRNGMYTYSRSFTDSTGNIKDVLTNNGFTRQLNNKKINLPPDRVKAFSASVNSVIYFALLPYGLNDPAVEKTLLGNVTIRGKGYYKIKVTFKQEGGGEHYQDQFLYWINQQTGTMDYFSYTEGGIRFRQAINLQVVNGIRFQDYINYKTTDSLNYLNIDKQFEAGTLEELSRIELKNIRVKLR